MISSFYAAILALLIVWLSLRVIKLRRIKKVRLGDGGEPELQVAIRAQGNATEYVPISLILLVLLELSGAHIARRNRNARRSPPACEGLADRKSSLPNTGNEGYHLYFNRIGIG